jgi:hypothetical protein
MIWFPIFLLFGLVSVEQGTIWPFVCAIVLWFIVSPKQQKWEREAGGHMFGAKMLFLLALSPFIYVILRDMLGGGL